MTPTRELDAVFVIIRACGLDFKSHIVWGTLYCAVREIRGDESKLQESHNLKSVSRSTDEAVRPKHVANNRLTVIGMLLQLSFTLSCSSHESPFLIFEIACLFFISFPIREFSTETGEFHSLASRCQRIGESPAEVGVIDEIDRDIIDYVDFNVLACGYSYK